MAGETIVFFPKYTTLCGVATYYSDPYEITGYKTVNVENLLIIAVGGGAPVLNVTLEGSSDLITWTALDGPTALTAGTVTTKSSSTPPRYVRMNFTTSGGTNMSVTVWSKGVARDA